MLLDICLSLLFLWLIILVEEEMMVIEKMLDLVIGVMVRGNIVDIVKVRVIYMNNVLNVLVI